MKSSSFSVKMKPTAGGPLRGCEEEFMGECRKLIVSYGVSICLCLELLREKTCETIYFLF